MPVDDGTGPPGSRRQPGGKGMGAGYGAGPTGTCVCPRCGHTAPHTRGQPCRDNRCPKCGSAMVRKD